MSLPTTKTTASVGEMTPPSEDTAAPLAVPVLKRKAPEPTNGFIHTRSCNNRSPCSCELRYESKKFQENLARKKGPRLTRSGAAARTNGRAAVKTLEHFEYSIKAAMAEFLPAVDLAALSMVNRQWCKDVDTMVERNSKLFVADETRKDKVYKAEKSKSQSWSRYLHLQMNCVHKLFVYYTGYKTGEMRKSTPQWAFGEVVLDPNDPSQTILPNSWSFNGHSPWIKQRRNGKGGEWRLLAPYQHGKAPKDFVRKVHDWVGTLRPGSLLAASFRHDEASEITWWEAQVWYVWRADGREDDAIVYDSQNDQEYIVKPSNLVEYFRANPEHVIDVCSEKRSVCRTCAKKAVSFYQCHVVKGHPML